MLMFYILYTQYDKWLCPMTGSFALCFLSPVIWKYSDHAVHAEIQACSSIYSLQQSYFSLLNLLFNETLASFYIPPDFAGVSCQNIDHITSQRVLQSRISHPMNTKLYRNKMHSEQTGIITTMPCIITPIQKKYQDFNEISQQDSNDSLPASKKLTSR